MTCQEEEKGRRKGQRARRCQQGKAEEKRRRQRQIQKH